MWHLSHSSSCCLVFWCWRPQAWQYRHRRQHQFSNCSWRGRSDSPRQKRWNGSQHTWQKTNSAFPLLAHKKQSTLGVIGTEVSRLRPPASHTFSTSWFLLKSTLIRCTPSQGALEFTWPLVEGVLCEFKVLLLGGLVVRGLSFGLCLVERGTEREVGFFNCFDSAVSETTVAELCCCTECCCCSGCVFFLGSFGEILGEASFFEHA